MKILNDKKGFTLIEMIVVVGIIGVLVAILVPRFTDIRSKSFAKATIANAKTVSTALELYYSENNNYPTLTSAVFLGSSTSSIESFLSVPLSNPYTGNAYTGSSESGGIEITTATGPDSFTVTAYDDKNNSLITISTDD